MAVYSGPEIINTGLAFYIDAGNMQRSWKGAPTTNIYAVPKDMSLWNKTTGITSIVGGFQTHITNDFNAYMVTANGTTNSFISSSGAVVSGTRYTRSVYAKAGTTGTLIFESYDNNGSGGTGFFATTFNLYSGTVSSTASGDTSSITSVGNGWYRCSTSRTLSLGFNNPGTIYIGTYGAGTGTMYLAYPQLETGSFATPHVSGARTTSQALVDMAGNKTVSVDSLTYNSDGSFEFNGSTNIASMATSVTITTNYTVEAWIKRSTTGVAHGIVTDIQYSWWMFYVNSSNKLSMYHARNLPTFAINQIAGTASIGTGWTHVACVFDSLQGMSLYVNGSLDNSNSNTTVFDLGVGRGPQFIGVSRQDAAGVNSNYFNGKIDQLKVYTSALSAASVKQSFEAMRGRYNI